ncbi:MAG: SRPBCC family protein [FCB group bacterium]|nr:SRPBCC family protein [FCB group bacterium]
MKVLNIHSKVYPVPENRLGFLLDSLSSKNDLLWPRKLWPEIKFNKALSISACGGHGPIRYFVKEYEPGKHIIFQFLGPRGFNGYHEYETLALNDHQSELRHSLKMNTGGWARLSWPLIFRPLHDALIEDSLSCAEVHLGLKPSISKWSPYVKFLRRMISGKKSLPQVFA